jgi:hypothetical protein
MSLSDKLHPSRYHSAAANHPSAEFIAILALILDQHWVEPVLKALHVVNGDVWLEHVDEFGPEHLQGSVDSLLANLSRLADHCGLDRAEREAFAARVKAQLGPDWHTEVDIMLAGREPA